ncbi:carboxypeptidase-like regulatory domain-containing protein [Emticicia sp. C21]|uniref:carboxypeptidase-like regulatory domain-containing protein n=1 Tax=Emticicia sp. C21 TaxID=2302915 RepID=UPI000E34F831|nr:carboxypeptidase-like regulatory domain-containing protein [Emticicia sp. C21]RFS17550.1 carboxypeptidase regulatory-like domain-containing protein [Emticicia sp. C21]
MKTKKMFLLILLQALLLTACTKTEEPLPDISTNTSPEKGVIKGRITDSQGNPMANAQVVIEHTVYYASYVYATSDANGYYKTNVPNGSWKASVQIQRNYQGQTYKFNLHPDNAEPFAGNTGAVRNFSWKLSGAKPEGGFYGSYVAVYPEPGAAFLMEDVELTLTPEGPLADGTTGKTITKSLTDIGGGEDGIKDVPLGKYIIAARNKANSQLLQIRIRNTGTYNNKVTGIFKSGYTGSTSYQIVVQVK